MIFLNTVKTVIFVIFIYLLFIFLNSTFYIYNGKADLFFFSSGYSSLQSHMILHNHSDMHSDFCRNISYYYQC